MSKFRPLKPEEINAIVTIGSRRGISEEIAPIEALVAYQKIGNFTIALVRDRDKLLVGCSKRNANEDRMNPIRGQMEALKRAVENPAVTL